MATLGCITLHITIAFYTALLNNIKLTSAVAADNYVCLSRNVTET